MYTAFITADGRAILNIAISESGMQGRVSIEMDDQDRIAMGNDRAILSNPKIDLQKHVGTTGWKNEPVVCRRD